MEIELNLPYAEIYTIAFPQNLHGKKQFSEYVRNELIRKHPGFCDSSLWDYKIVKVNDIKVIKAAVLNRDFYLEKMLSQKNICFYLSDNNKNKIQLFSSLKFSKQGTRRKVNFLPFVIISLLLLLILFLFVIEDRNDTPQKIAATVPDVRIIDTVNIFDVINQFAFIIDNHNAKIDLVQFGNGIVGELVFSVTGCEPYSLVRDLCEIESVSECRCDGVVYSDGKEKFEIKAYVVIPSIIQKQAEEIELLALQSRIAVMLKENNATLASSSVDPLSGKMGFQFMSDRTKLSDINKEISNVCYKENIFITSFNESKASEKDLFFISFECVQLTDGQRITEANEKEILSAIFAEDKNIEIKPTTTQKLPVINDSEVKLKNYKKIGSVKKEGKLFYYYRTEEGKIIVSEDIYE